MTTFGPSKKERMISNLLDIKHDEDLFKSLTTLQNEMAVGFETKVIAISSVKNDSISAAFAKGLADAYALNKENVLLIDANLYNPSLEKVLGDDEAKQEGEYRIHDFGEGVSALYLEKQVYPGEIYKSGAIQKIVKEQSPKYKHIVIITPSIKEHKEIVLLRDIIQSIILVSERNVTLKKHIYEACAFFAEEKLPLAKTVVLK